MLWVVIKVIYYGVAYPDRLTDRSDCLLLLSADRVIMLEHSVVSDYKGVYPCIQSPQCRKLHQTAGHLLILRCVKFWMLA